ncbi:MAG: thioredoxin family protein [bacterium]
MKNLLLVALLAFAAGACDKPAETATAEEAKPAEAAAEPAAAAKADEAPAKEEAPTATAQVGQPAPDFELKDETGKTHKLSDYKGKIVVLEWTNPDCPYVVRHYEKDTMQTTFKALGEDKIVWLAVDSSNFVKPEDSAKWKTAEGFTYPVLQDASGAVGKIYQAKTTPHMFVVDAEGTLRYEGAIDNDPKGKEEKPENYVEKAVTSLLEGKELETSQTKPYGCSVKYGS